MTKKKGQRLERRCPWMIVLVTRLLRYDSLRLILRNTPVGILILCHTLNEADCLAALDTADKIRSGIKNLVLTNHPRRYDEHDVSPVISGLLDPDVILRRPPREAMNFAPSTINLWRPRPDENSALFL